jgi:uncharacterized protein (TIGR02147 family)
MASLTVKHKHQLLKEDQFQMMSDWYHLAIRQLSNFPAAKADPRWVAQKLGIGISEAQTAIERLRRLELLTSNQFELKAQGDPFEVISEVPSQAIRKFHKQVLGLAQSKIETVSVEKRYFSTLAISINPKVIPKANKLIQEFQRKMSSLLSEGEPSEVYVLSQQLFPLTVQPEEKGN